MTPRSVMLACLAVWAVPATAQVVEPASENQVVIGSGGGAPSGVTTVNAASGNQNQQLNTGTVAAGALARSAPSASQHLDNPAAAASGTADTSLAAGAFAGFGGWVAVNGVSGNANQQANLAAFAFGIEAGAATDISLAQSRASTEPTGGKGAAAHADPQRSVAIGEGAFEGGSGLVQVSLIGGDRNTSANTFALSVSGGAKP